MNKNKIWISALAVIVVIVIWYFFAPIKWTFGLVPPRNYDDCIKLGGKVRAGDAHQGIGGYESLCSYKDKVFDNGVFINF